MKKVRIHEGRIWNTLIYDFEEKKLLVRYFKIAPENFLILPRYDSNYNNQKISVISWLCFKFGQATIGKLKRTLQGNITDESTGYKYRVSLRKDFYSVLSPKRN